MGRGEWNGKKFVASEPCIKQIAKTKTHNISNIDFDRIN